MTISDGAQAMSSLGFVAQLIDSLAWPATILVIGLLFRREIRRLLERMRRARAGGTEFDFGVTEAATAALQAVVQTEVELTKPSEAREAEAKDGDRVSEQNQNRLPRLDGQSDESKHGYVRVHVDNSDDSLKRHLISASWRRVENALVDLAKAANVFGTVESPGQFLGPLIASDIINLHDVVTFNDLARLQERAATRMEFDASNPSVNQYVLLASNLEARFTQLAYIQKAKRLGLSSEEA